MKRGSGFIIAFLAAAATFGSLMAFVGPQQSGWHHYGSRNGWRNHHHHGHCYRYDSRQAADSSR